MEQNQSIIGKECIIEQIFPQLTTTKEQKGLILDVQEDMAIVALKDIHEECTFFTAKKDTPKGAYIPKMWEMLKYYTHLRKYWPIKYRYWSSQFYYQDSSYSYLGCLYLDSDFCDMFGNDADDDDRLFAGYFTKVPLKQLHIIK